MKFLKLCFVFCSLLCSISVLSGEWSPTTKVVQTYVHAAHGGYSVYQLENMSSNPDNCTSPVYYVLSKSNSPVFDEIYSLLLAAHMSGKKVQVWMSGCSPHNHMEIRHARIVQ